MVCGNRIFHFIHARTDSLQSSCVIAIALGFNDLATSGLRIRPGDAGACSGSFSVTTARSSSSSGSFSVTSTRPGCFVNHTGLWREFDQFLWHGISGHIDEAHKPSITKSTSLHSANVDRRIHQRPEVCFHREEFENLVLSGPFRILHQLCHIIRHLAVCHVDAGCFDQRFFKLILGHTGSGLRVISKVPNP